MPRLPQEKDDKSSSDFEVLLTGFGPFGPYASNPSWESVKQLHDRTFKSLGQGQRKIRVQSINLPVLYHSTLDTIPRLHGLKPSSPHARADTDPRGPQDGAQGRGSSYPEGWQVDHPVNGFDLIIHVGVGAPGGIKLEQQAHKTGYHLRDAFGLAPPAATMQGPIARVAWTVKRPIMLIGKMIGAALSLVVSAKWMRKLQNLVAQGGFGRGYEPCSQLPRTDLDVYALVQHLRANGHTYVAVSHDPGRYLCDFTYYASLVESQRALHNPAGQHVQRRQKTDVLFIHVPPEGRPQFQEQRVRLLKDVVQGIALGLGRAPPYDAKSATPM
ncbi:unnamed protein product [Jaminaea pallidilutea]